MGESNSGQRARYKLSAAFVRQCETPGVFVDGGGLRLKVEAGGSKRWLLRLTVRGKQREIGLGSFRDVSLAEARELAAEMRRQSRAGRDPIAERRALRVSPLSFEEAARKVHAQRANGWSSGKHHDQWINTLQRYAFETVGMKPVDEIGTGDVLAVLDPIWLTKPETARRVRQRIRAVLEWAAASGLRDPNGANPADLATRGLPRQPRRDGHHAAMPWQDVPPFVQRLLEAPIEPSVRLALCFVLLTVGRSGEVRGATIDEIDLKARLWTVPADRMKAKREHRVPLSPFAAQIVTEARELWPLSPVLFPGRRGDRALSDMALSMPIRRMGLDATPHGFRSSFRDWAADNGKPRDAAEAALAHALPNRTEAAYRRTDLLDLRRPLMEAWTTFCFSEVSGAA